MWDFRTVATVVDVIVVGLRLKGDIIRLIFFSLVRFRGRQVYFFGPGGDCDMKRFLISWKRFWGLR